MSTLKLSFVLNGDTKNTLKFVETDPTGRILKVSEAKIGTIYVKKTFFNGTEPRHLRATLDFI